MTRRRDIERKHRGLEEIRGIVNSMKTLAYMETRKLAAFLDAQQQSLDAIESVANDFLQFYPELLPASEGLVDTYLVIGSERGFCGDFNRRIETSLDALLTQRSTTTPKLIALGRKLHPAILQRDPTAELLPGAGVQEEIPPLLDNLSQVFGRLARSEGIGSLTALFHGSEGGIETRPLLPPFSSLSPPAGDVLTPPLLNITPEDFFGGLTEHYLFAVLHWVLYISLMAENRQRVAHLEGAIRHLDNQSLKLKHLYNVLRQEEIIEEIEVILLNTG